MKNLGTWVACAILALTLGKEFIDWMWGLYQDWEEDDPSRTPLLLSSLPVWWKLDMLGFKLLYRLWWPVQRWLEDTFPRLFPAPEPPPTLMDADRRTPDEWLAIGVIGVWNLEWYEGEYDGESWQQVSRDVISCSFRSCPRSFPPEAEGGHWPAFASPASFPRWRGRDRMTTCKHPGRNAGSAAALA